ncbi:MAG: DUF362 domain-containing protein [Candidatus Omnitrophica bacterium]|nr:DUF362 domain-containing protein [Candidatus Omnitrophota bacterium]
MDRFFYNLECFLKQHISRGRFIKLLLGGALYFISNNALLKYAFARTARSGGRPKKNIKGDHDLVVSKGPDPYNNTEKAIEGIGGMDRFVKKGDVVFLKANISWDRSPEQAGNTNPYVVAALVDMCYAAGAKRVNMSDNTCNEARRSYDNSEIPRVAREKGAYVHFVDNWNVVKAEFPYRSPMHDWPIYREAVECDVFINVPILKHHRLTGLTLSMKNLMGVCSGTRGLIHAGIGRKLADLTDYISPELTVIDATRVLLRNGPSGGSLDDVARMDTVIAGTDPVLADSYACTLVDRDPMSITYIEQAVRLGYGSADLTKADILKVKGGR